MFGRSRDLHADMNEIAAARTEAIEDIKQTKYAAAEAMETRFRGATREIAAQRADGALDRRQAMAMEIVKHMNPERMFQAEFRSSVTNLSQWVETGEWPKAEPVVVPGPAMNDPRLQQARKTEYMVSDAQKAKLDKGPPKPTPARTRKK